MVRHRHFSRGIFNLLTKRNESKLSRHTLTFRFVRRSIAHNRKYHQLHIFFLDNTSQQIIKFNGLDKIDIQTCLIEVSVFYSYFLLYVYIHSEIIAFLEQAIFYISEIKRRKKLSNSNIKLDIIFFIC